MYVYAFIKNTHTKKRPNGSISCIVYVNGFFCVETPLVIAFPMKRPGEREVLLLRLAPRRMLGPYRTLKAVRISKRPEPKVECNNSDRHHPFAIIVSHIFAFYSVWFLFLFWNWKKLWKLLLWMNVEKMNKVSPILIFMYLRYQKYYIFI